MKTKVTNREELSFPLGGGYNNVTFEPGCRNNWHIHHGAVQEISSNEWCEPVSDEDYAKL